MASDDNPLSINYVAEQIALTRETIARSNKLLARDKPDTFAGRKTQEPFPVDDPMQRDDMQNLIHSELQPPAK